MNKEMKNIGMLLVLLYFFQANYSLYNKLERNKEANINNHIQIDTLIRNNLVNKPFLKMSAKYLEKLGYKVIKINKIKNDHLENSYDKIITYSNNVNTFKLLKNKEKEFLVEFSVFQKFQGFSNFLQIGNNISSITKKASKAGIISLIDEEFTGIINVEFKNYRIAKVTGKYDFD